MGTEIDDAELNRIRNRLMFLAARRYRLAAQDASDVFQNTMATWYEIRDRYRGEANPTGILVGVFRKKCLEFIDTSVRENRKLRALARSPDARMENPKLDPEGRGSSPSALRELIQEEERQRILDALAALRPEAREMFRLLAEDELGRKGLIERYGINRNTLDTRLHVYRRELKDLLRRHGVSL